MDANQSLLWIVAASAVMTIVRLTRPNVPRMPGYLVVAAATLAICGIGMYLAPQLAGYLAAGAWLLFFIAPTLVTRRLTRLVQRQDYAGARAWGRLLVVLHPADGVREHIRLIGANEASSRGDVARALDILEGLRAQDPRRARLYEAQRLRIQGRWRELAALELRPEDLRIAPVLMALRVRAAGEVGGAAAAASEYQRFEARFAGRMLAQVADLARLYLFAFAGDRDAVDRLLRTSPALLLYPEAVRRFWLASADLFAGREERGREELRGLLDAEDRLVRADAAARLEQPAGQLGEAAASAALSVAARAANELVDEQRFGVRRPDQRSAPKGTLALLAAMVAVYFVQEARGGATDLRAMYDFGAMWPPAVAAGEWWRLVVSTWMHGGVMHLGMNAVALLALGPFVERSLGVTRYLVVYLLAAVACNAALFALMRAGVVHPNVVVGASGGIMGIVGAWAAVLLVGWRTRRARVAGRRLVLVLGIVAMQTVFDFATPNISFAAHALGLGIGFVATMVLTPRSGVGGVRAQERI